MRQQRLAGVGSAAGVEAAHLLEVAGEVALVDEVGRRRLQQFAAAAEEQRGDLAEALHLTLRHYQVGQAQAGVEHLAEGPGVEHAAVAVEALERGQRPALVAVFAVVVVFDHPALHLPRPLQQGQAPGQRQRHAGGALVRGGDQGEARLGCQAQAVLHPQPFTVHRHWHAAHAEPFQQLAGMGVAGVLQPDGLARPHQCALHQGQAGAVAGGDEHLLGPAVDAPGDAEVARQARAQGEVAGRVRHHQCAAAQLAQAPGRQACPELAWEGIQGRQAELEGLGRGLCRVRAFGPGRAAGTQGGPGRRGQPGRDAGPGGATCQQITFGDQHLVGHLHRAPRQVQFAGQAAQRRHPGAGLQPALLDGLAKALVQLQVHRGAQVAVEVEGEGAARHAHVPVVSMILGPGCWSMACLE